MNRQSRALLTILIVAAVLVPYWLLSRPDRDRHPSADRRASRAAHSAAAAVVASARSEPRSFNRIVQPDMSTELFALLTLGKLGPRQPGHPGGRTVAGGDMEGLARQSDLHPDACASGVTWSDGTPFTADDVLFSFQAIYDPRSKSPLASAMLELAAAPDFGHVARPADGRRDLSRRSSARASGCSTT